MSASLKIGERNPEEKHTTGTFDNNGSSRPKAAILPHDVGLKRNKLAFDVFYLPLRHSIGLEGPFC